MTDAMEATDVVTGEIVPVDPVRAGMINTTTDNWMGVYGGDARTLAMDLCKTDFMPKGLRGNPPAALGVILKGREVGLPPIAAMQGLYAVDGRVGFYAETMRALILNAGHEYRIKEQSMARCVIEGRRVGQDMWQPFAFTLQEAKDAGLVGKDNWKKWPADMLLARATGRMCKALFPDVTMGMATAEEVMDVAGAVDTPTVSVTQVESVPSTVQRKPRTTKKRTETPAGPEPEREPVPVGEVVKPAVAELLDNDQPEPEPVVDDRQANPRQVGMIIQHLGRRLGVTDRDERLFFTALVAGRTDPYSLATTKELTASEATEALHKLERVRSLEDLEALNPANERQDNDGGEEA